MEQIILKTELYTSIWALIKGITYLYPRLRRLRLGLHYCICSGFKKSDEQEIFVTYKAARKFITNSKLVHVARCDIRRMVNMR